MVPSVYDCCKVQHTMYLHEKTIFFIICRWSRGVKYTKISCDWLKNTTLLLKSYNAFVISDATYFLNYQGGAGTLQET